MLKIKCRFCLSRKVVEYGVRRGKYVCKQRYFCKKCGKTFVLNDGFLNRKFSPEIITVAMDLWVRGLSLRQIKQHVWQHHGVRVNHVTILLWLRKYGEIIANYTDSLEPDLKGDWQADELVHYFKKNHNWLWNVMHKDRKFLIASRYTRSRIQKHADDLFKEARLKGTPREIQTDGLPNYPSAIRKAFDGKVRHTKHSSLQSKKHMNIVERQQGNCRSRLKTTRGFHSIKTARQLWKIWPVYFNYIRPHMGLKGKTPAEACGVKLPLDKDGWKKLIEMSVGA